MKILYVEQSERQFDHFKRNINANSKFKSNLKVFTTLLLANFILSPEQVNAEEMVESIVVTATRKAESILSVPIAIDTLSAGQGNRILLPKNKLCSEFIGPASHFEFASHAGFLGV